MIKKWMFFAGLAVFFSLALFPIRAFAMDSGFREFTVDDLDLGEIQAFLDGLTDGAAAKLSFGDMLAEIMKGNLSGVLQKAASGIGRIFLSEIRTNGALMGQIIILAFAGAVFSCFSGIFGFGHVPETGFYVVYLLIMTFLAAGISSGITVAQDAADKILSFMRVLLPAYFLAAAMAGGAITSTAVCGFTFAAIGVVQTVLADFLIPMMRVYMMMVLAGNLYKEDMLSKLTELLRKLILWTVKAMFGIIVGFHMIQGMVLPGADALKNTTAMRMVEMIPGIGAGAGTVSRIIMGSGLLIKNTLGAAAVVVLLLLAAVPVIKLLVLMLLYYLAASVMQPVCDSRIVSCVWEAASGYGMLLRIVGYSLALFSLTIAVLCISTGTA